MATSAMRPKPPDESQAWLDAYCDGEVIRVEESIKPGADVARVRAAQEKSLRDALAGKYSPGGVERPFDLTEQWFVLRVVVTEGSDYAGLGGGPLDAPADHLRSVHDLAEAALAHIPT
jgi:hypothetical protein